MLSSESTEYNLYCTAQCSGIYTFWLKQIWLECQIKSITASWQVNKTQWSAFRKVMYSSVTSEYTSSNVFSFSIKTEALIRDFT